MGRSLPTPDLKQETATHFQAGFRRPAGARSSVELTGFCSWVRNLMQAYYLAPNLYQIRNLGKVTHSGAEISARSAVTAGLLVELQYVYLNRRNVSQAGVPLVQSPRHQARLSAAWRLARGVLLAVESQMEHGRWTLNEAGRYLRASDLVTVNVSAIVPLARGVEFRAGARNITDRNYFYDEGYPEPGRSVFGGLSWKF
jgi:iron complex outermembrane receptor protein